MHPRISSLVLSAALFAPSLALEKPSPVQPDAAAYKHPTWDRRCESLASGCSQVHSHLQRAAQLHQDGALDQAVQHYKKAIQQDPKNGEAYASLSKCLIDQGKHDLADKAFAKAQRIYHAQLAAFSLF